MQGDSGGVRPAINTVLGTGVGVAQASGVTAPDVAVARTVRRAVGRLVGMNSVNLGASLGVGILLASKFGATGTKDALDAAIAIPRTAVQTFGAASLGGASLYVIGRLSDSNRPRVGSILLSILVVQGAYSLLLFACLIGLEDRAVAYFAADVAVADRMLLHTALRWTACSLLLRPVLTLLGSAATGLQMYGTMQVGNLLEKLGAVCGLLLVGAFGVLAYPVGTMGGLVVGILLLFAILRRRGVVLEPPVQVNSSEVREAFRQALPWMATAPLANASAWLLVPLMLRMAPGSYASYGYAVVLNTMMLSLVLVPLTDALAPLLARYAGGSAVDSDPMAREQEREMLRLGFRLSVFAGIALFVLNVGLARPLVGMLFFHGALTQEGADRIAVLTMILGTGLLGRAIVTYLSRVFQAQVSVQNSVVIQFSEPLIALPIAFVFSSSLGVAAVAIGASASVLVGSAVGVLLGRRKTGPDVFKLEASGLLWAGCAVILAGGLASLPMGLVPGILPNMARLVLYGGVITVLLAFLGLALEIREFVWLKNRMIRLAGR